MTTKSQIQHESLSSSHIEDLLIYFKSCRNFTNRDLAEKLHYQENYLTRVRNGTVEGGEKLLHALEMFFKLDTLNQIARIDSDIAELQRQKTVLQQQTLEKFYEERKAVVKMPPVDNPSANEDSSSTAVDPALAKTERLAIAGLKAGTLSSKKSQSKISYRRKKS